MAVTISPAAGREVSGNWLMVEQPRMLVEGCIETIW